VITIVAALLHGFEVGAGDEHGGTFPDALVLVSIAVPAAGAALSGIRAEQEFERHAERYRQATAHLRAQRDALRGATDATGVRRVVADVEALMMEENEDWLGVVWFHDFELHV
jgi:hypothetical protein